MKLTETMQKRLRGSVFLLFLIFLVFQMTLLSKRTEHKISPHRSHAPKALIVAPAVVDAINDILRIPTLQAGLITSLPIVVGQTVKKGQILCALDDAMARNHLTIQTIKLEQANNALLLHQKQIAHLKRQLTRLYEVDKRAISRVEIQEKKHEVTLQAMQLKEAQTNLDLAKANVREATLLLSQFTIIAPKDGVVLQLSAHLNDYVGSSQLIVLLGDLHKSIVRVSLDERDLQHFNPKARAYITSNEQPHLKIPLFFLQLDQYIVTQERLNARVQEALYYFDRSKYPQIVAGQQFDATIPMHRST